jgi:hypothetical protein
VDPVPDPLLLRKSGSAGTRTRDLWVCSQELGPLDHRDGLRRTQKLSMVLVRRCLICKFRCQYTDHIWDMKIGNRSLENVSQFKYLETTVTNQNLIPGEVKRSLNAGNVCYHSVQNHRPSRPLSNSVYIRICTVIIPFCSAVWVKNLVSDIK